MQAQPNEILGNSDAPHIIKFEYCGGWGYRSHCVKAINLIEATYPGQFQYNLYRDKGTTGRLEVTVYLNTKDDQGEGILIHSKAATKKYISQDEAGFMEALAEAMSKQWSHQKYVILKWDKLAKSWWHTLNENLCKLTFDG